MIGTVGSLRLLKYRTWAPPAPGPAPAPVTAPSVWGGDRLPAFLLDAFRPAPARPGAASPSAPAAPVGRPFRFDRDKQFEVYGGSGATWLCGTKWDATTARRVADEARRTGTTPVFAMYAIPGRDNKGASAGGARDLASYKQTVEATARAIGDAPCMIVVEPDGLALGLNADCVREAVRLFKRHCPNARVYVDAGHSSWKSPDEAARLLVAGGISEADGFALNVSAFQWTNDNLAYGDRLRAALAKRDPALAGKTYVVDTSRNGNGPGVDEQGKGTWGDPIRAKNGGPIMNGPKPTWDTGHAGADAYLWVKGPGHGDGRIRPASRFGGEDWVKHNPRPPLGP